MHARSFVSDTKRNDPSGSDEGSLFSEITESQSSKGSRIELVSYGGVVWRRYPDNKHFNARYFQRNGVYLHRRVYSDHIGTIESGMHIHHIDGDVRNNRPSNLSQCSNSNHMSQHPEVVKKMQKAAVQWRRDNSDKAREVAKIASDAYWSKPRIVCVNCSVCGTEIKTKDVRTNRKRICSVKCGEISRSTAETVCPTCGETFKHPPKRQRSYCSRKCAANYRRSSSGAG